jgi:hypothetical protein
VYLLPKLPHFFKGVNKHKNKPDFTSIEYPLGIIMRNKNKMTWEILGANNHTSNYTLKKAIPEDFTLQV